MVCQNCKASLNGKVQRNTRKFCSVECRKAAHYRKVKELARTEWYSPAEIVEAARATLGEIDLDPASCEAANEVVRADRFYSVRDDGLCQPWFGKVWLNPPYGRYAPKFVDRFAKAFAEGSVEQGVLLLATHHLTTDWFSSLAVHDLIGCFPRQRLQFSDSSIRPAHGSIIIGVGVSTERFKQAFSSFGTIWVHSNGNEHRIYQL